MIFRLIPYLSSMLVVFCFATPNDFTSQLVTASALEKVRMHHFTVPISVYILDDDGGDLSSSRTKEQLDNVFNEVNRIWEQAGIKIDVKHIQRLKIPSTYLESLSNGDFIQFFSGIYRDFSLHEPSLLNAFYARNIGGENGRAFPRFRMLFVTDNPSVHHERVTSHEIGHILGLPHTSEDTGRLMYSGTNGTNLTRREIGVARLNAHKLQAIKKKGND